MKKGASVYFASSRAANYGAFTNIVAAAKTDGRYGLGRVTLAPFVNAQGFTDADIARFRELMLEE